MIAFYINYFLKKVRYIYLLIIVLYNINRYKNLKERREKCETKINQNVQKKTNLKTSLNNLEKNRIIEYYGLVNLETSKPDFLRNSIADSSVKTCCFIGGLGFLNDS